MSAPVRGAGANAGYGARAWVVAGSALLDTACVVVFAALGRSQHGRVETLAGLWQTAWPFLVALAAVWVVARAWRKPIALLRSGLPVWIGTVALGLVLRVVFTAGGAALPFVLVATGTLGLALLGWRAIARLISLLRAPRH